MSLSISIKIPHARDEAKNDNNMENFIVGDTRFIRCKACFQFPGIVKQMSNQKQPAIATPSGTKYRNDVYQENKSKPFHTECVRAYNLEKLKETSDLTADVAPMDAP